MSANGERQPPVRALAELLVRFGANVQPGQIVSVSSEPGKEALARAIAEVAYEEGAKFVDVSTFDMYVKHARVLGADPETLDFVPPWYGHRIKELSDLRAAMISLAGPVAPKLMQDVDPKLLGRDLLPRVRESIEAVNARTTNWTIGPCPTPGWAEMVHPQLEPAEALARLWQEIGHVCRLDEPDPIAAWTARMDLLTSVADKLDALHLDSIRLDGPGTELTIGLLPSSRWDCARLTTAEGIVHAPNLPTEEIFTTPDPERVNGHVTATKPLFASGALIAGLQVRFEGGRAVEITADEGADALRGMSQRDAGASRLGEVALVDRDSRIGNLRTVFYDTLLDENAASHIALGQGLAFALEGDADLQRINSSEIHIDFMIGSPEVTATGLMESGEEVALLREGAWQV